MGVQRPAEQLEAEQGYGSRKREAQRHRRQPRHGEQPPGTEEEHETQRAPSIPPGAQMRSSPSPVRFEAGGHLGDPKLLLRRADDHLDSEFHPRRVQRKAPDGVTAKAPQPAVRVRDPGPEEDVEDEGEHRVAEDAVQEGHGAVVDHSAKTRAHHQLVSLAQALEEARNVLECVAVVRVAHHHVATARRLDAGLERRAVSLLLHVDHVRAGLARQLRRAVARAVVGDQHLGLDSGRAACSQRLAHAGGHGLCLVQARHENRELDRREINLRGDVHAVDCRGPFRGEARNREVLGWRSLWGL